MDGDQNDSDHIQSQGSSSNQEAEISFDDSYHAPI